jgi:hypothetical protein
MLKGITITVVLFALLTLNNLSHAQLAKTKTHTSKTFKTIRQPYKNKNSRKNLKALCKKAKNKIITLEARARQKSTSKLQRCKRAYSELRYQACHRRKYDQKKIDAAKNCNR